MIEEQLNNIFALDKDTHSATLKIRVPRVLPEAT
jgi:hypothetical protein